MKRSFKGNIMLNETYFALYVHRYAEQKREVEGQLHNVIPVLSFCYDLQTKSQIISSGKAQLWILCLLYQNEYTNNQVKGNKEQISS